MKTLARALAFGSLFTLPAAAQTGAPQPVAVSGTLAGYDPGRTLILRDALGRETTYALGPGVAVPRDLAIGRTVTVFATPAEGGAPSVSRVVLGAGAPESPPAPLPSPSAAPAATASASPTPPAPAAGAAVERDTSSEPAPRPSTVSGVVTGYVAGKAIALRTSTGRELSFYLDAKAPGPKGLRVGSRVVVATEPLAGSSDSIVRRIEDQSARAH